MKKTHLLAAALCVSALPLQAAESKKKDADKPEAKAAQAAKSGYTLPDTVAVVEGTEIKRGEVEQALNTALAQQGGSAVDIPDAQKIEFYRNVVDALVVEKLVQKRSEKIEVPDKDVEEQFAKLRAQFPSEDALNAALKQSGETAAHLKDTLRSSLKEQKWIDSKIAGKIEVSDADAQGFYEKNPDKFKLPEQVRASHILVMVPEGADKKTADEKEKLANKIAERAKKGEAFDKLAKEFSEDPRSKNSGGDLNFFSRGQMVPEFENTAFKLKKDEISAPVKSQFGWHIIKTTDHKDARTVSFDEAKPRILAYLQNQKRRAAVDEVIAELRAKADVKVNLPPPAVAPASAPAAVSAPASAK